MPPRPFFKKRAPTLVKNMRKPTSNMLSVSPDATYLVIVESPSKCKKIEEYLGPDYACIASKGHIRTIDGLKSIDTKTSFEPMFSIIDEKKAHVEQMRSVIERFPKNHIILATDDDREGEAIAWHICDVFGLSELTTKRIIFHEITKSAICKAVQNQGHINMALVYAQQARQVLDIIVGFKVSPFLWKYLFSSKSNSLSAGRCQTPALRLVYENEQSKEDLEKKYKIKGRFLERNIEFDLQCDFVTETDVVDFLEKTKTFSHMLSVNAPKETRQSAPSPFNTSRLLQSASNQLRMSPKETMSLCQQLYQDGHITYMRTESTQYSRSFLQEVERFVLSHYKTNTYLGNMDALENKDKNNPHEAIRVTHIETSTIGDSMGRVDTLYRLIWRNSIESCMADATYQTTRLTIQAPSNKQYNHVIDIPHFLGWKKIAEKSANENELTALRLYMLSIEKAGKPVKYNNIDATVTMNAKHSHFSEASLIHKLEHLGIGRPSTFASIVDTIQERDYVKKRDIEGDVVMCREFTLRESVIEVVDREKTFGNEKNKLVISPTGILAIEFLIKHFPEMFSYDYTKTMEKKLDMVSSKDDGSTVCRDCFDKIVELSKPIAKIEKEAFAIDDSHEFMVGQYGPVIKHTTDEGKIEYKAIKKDIRIDMEKIKQHGYSLIELTEIKNASLGKYNGCDVYLKTGKYGPYVECGDSRTSIKTIEKPFSKITLSDVEPLLSVQKDDQNTNILRVLNSDMSVRKGKFGPYVFYKTDKMDKPLFVNINTFNEGYAKCAANVLIEWVTKKAKVPH